MATVSSSPCPPHQQRLIMTTQGRLDEHDDIYTLLQKRISQNNRTLQKQTESVLYAATTTTTNTTLMNHNMNYTAPHHAASRHAVDGGSAPDQSHSVAGSSKCSSKSRELGSLWWSSNKSSGVGSSVSSMTFTTHDSRAQQHQQRQRETARRMAQAYQKGQEQMALRRWMAQNTKQQGLATRREWMQKSRELQQQQHQRMAQHHHSEEHDDSIRGRPGQGGESGISALSNRKSQSTNTTTERRRSFRMSRRGSTGTSPAVAQSPSIQPDNNAKSFSPSSVIGTPAMEAGSASWFPHFNHNPDGKPNNTFGQPDVTVMSTSSQNEHHQQDASSLVSRATRKMTRRGSTGNLPLSSPGTMASSPSNLFLSNVPAHSQQSKHDPGHHHYPDSNDNTTESSNTLLLDHIGGEEPADMESETMVHESDSSSTSGLSDEPTTVLGKDATTIPFIHQDTTPEPPTPGCAAATTDGTINRDDETLLEMLATPLSSSSFLTDKCKETEMEQITQHSSKESQA